MVTRQNKAKESKNNVVDYEAKDFSTMRKTLRILQKVQATTDAFSFWLNFTHYDDCDGISVTIFKHSGDDPEPSDFYFYGFLSKEDRLRQYEEMMKFLNEE